MDPTGSSHDDAAVNEIAEDHAEVVAEKGVLVMVSNVKAVTRADGSEMTIERDQEEEAVDVTEDDHEEENMAVVHFDQRYSKSEAVMHWQTRLTEDAR